MRLTLQSLPAQAVNLVVKLAKRKAQRGQQPRQPQTPSIFAINPALFGKIATKRSAGTPHDTTAMARGLRPAQVSVKPSSFGTPPSALSPRQPGQQAVSYAEQRECRHESGSQLLRRRSGPTREDCTWRTRSSADANDDSPAERGPDELTNAAYILYRVASNLESCHHLTTMQ